MDKKELKNYLPHREPFLFVDEVLRFEQDYILAKKIVIEQDIMAGHFPGNPIFPGVLIVESLGQAATILCFKQFNKSILDEMFLLTSVNKAKFKKQVKLKDKIILEVKLNKHKLDVYKFSATAYVDEDVVALLEFNAVCKIK